MSTSTEVAPARRRSRLVIEADAAARALLLSELERCDWRLSVAAEALEMDNASNLLRAIRRLGLQREYAAARVAKIQSPSAA